MSNIQITQIQLRRGLDADLLPQTLAPGEPALTLDTGRMFLGTDPNTTGFWSTRQVAPYDAIEVLTEASLTTFARLFDRMNRTLGAVDIVENLTPRRSFLQAILAPTTTAINVPLKTVDLTSNTGAYSNSVTEPMYMFTGPTGAVRVDYMLSNGSNMTRTGMLTIVHNGNSTSDQALVEDEYVRFPAVSSAGAPVSMATAFPPDVTFSAVRQNIGPSLSACGLQFVNLTQLSYTLFARVTSIVPTTP